MTRRSLARLAQMDVGEAAWRSGVLARTLADRARWTLARPHWNRAELLRILAPDPGLEEARAALAAGRWSEASRALAWRFVRQPQRFAIAPALRSTLPDRIRRAFPAAAADAARRADRLLAGEYDLLGYQRLRFGADRAAGARVPSPDWHLDPVHGRRAPARFWTSVPYLDPACGDHKVIWELNRHQHWLALGRAFWLTGDARYRGACLAELTSWLVANPPLAGINWASMLELGLRSISWIWALNFFADPDETDDPPWMVDLLLGLDRQLRHLARNLSYYFSPNTHLLGEALALYVAGRALPELARSARYAALGRRVLLDEIDRQIAPDGGHVERSTHYHRYTLDFYLLALVAARATADPVAQEFERAVVRLGSAARALADDRGRLPHLGDDDGGLLLPIAGRAPDDVADTLASAAALTARPDLRVGPPPEESFWLLAEPTLASALDRSAADRGAPAAGSVALVETGYFVSRSNAGDHVVIDAGPHGYRNGGHAHADALSLTLTVRHAPLVVDPGTFCYTIDRAARDRFRSTALHNTLIVDGRPQSVPAGPFHWKSAARGEHRRWRANAGFDYFEGRHDGYRPLEHRRHVLVLHGELLIVADVLIGAGRHAVSAHWHVDRQWHVEQCGSRLALSTSADRVDLLVPAGRVRTVTADEASGLGWQAPVYGRLDEATTIQIDRDDVAPVWVFTIFGLSRTDPVVEAEVVPVWSEAGTLANGAGLRITHLNSTDYVVLADPAAGGARQAWRIGEIETDAAMLFYRSRGRAGVTRLALVDGSFARTAGRRFQLTLPRRVPGLHADLAGPSCPASDARVCGPGFGACVVVDGRTLPVSLERRAAPRQQGVG